MQADIQFHTGRVMPPMGIGTWQFAFVGYRNEGSRGFA